MASPVKGTFKKIATTLAGSSVLALGAPVMAQDAPPPETTTVATSTPALARFESIIGANQYTILGDTDHSKRPDIYGFVAQPDFLDTFKRAGGKEIAMEIPSQYQYIADELVAKSKIPSTPAQDRANVAAFVDNMQNAGIILYYTDAEGSKKTLTAIGNIAVGAAQRDIGVTFADYGEGFSNKSAERMAEKLTDEYIKEFGKKMDRMAAATEMSQNDTFITKHEKEFVKIADAVVGYRETREGNLSVMQSAIAGDPDGGKAIILFGAGHAKALREDLAKAGRSSSTVFLHASRDDFEKNIVGYGPAISGDMRARPGVANFLIKEGNFAAAADSAAPAPKGPVSRPGSRPFYAPRDP